MMQNGPCRLEGFVKWLWYKCFTVYSFLRFLHDVQLYKMNMPVGVMPPP